ncbi:hypothetical protein P885DRAFT_80942 [Corynascus similis CBS 632.67]
MANLSEKLSDDDASVLLSEAANPDVERDDYSSGQRVVVDLGFIFNRTQLIGRCLSTFLNLGALIFIAYLYDHWRPKPAIKVDVLIPSFFPLVAAFLADTYEMISLLFLNRKKAISPVSVCFDILLVGLGIFSFMVLSMVNGEGSEQQARWAADTVNAMIVMIVFSFVHTGFIILAASGMVRIHRLVKKTIGNVQSTQNQVDTLPSTQSKMQIMSQPGMTTTT